MNGYNSYISGSTLPKYGYAPGVQTKPQPQIKKKASSKENNARYYKMFMIVLFTAVFVIVFRSAVIAKMNNEIAALNSNLAKIEKQVQQSAVKLESMTDLNTVQEVATTELNMGLPQQHQIVELDLDMGSKTVAVKSGTDNGENFFSKAWEFCKEYLY
jgi:cell division protein FtsL